MVLCCSHLQFHVVSLLSPIAILSSLTGGLLSHLKFSTRPQYQPKNLRFLTTTVVSFLIFVATDTVLNQYLSRIDRIQKFLCSACGHPAQSTSHFILSGPASNSLCCSLFGDSLFLSLLPPCSHPPERGRKTTTQTSITTTSAVLQSLH